VKKQQKSDRKREVIDIQGMLGEDITVKADHTPSRLCGALERPFLPFKGRVLIRIKGFWDRRPHFPLFA
jgi:hypothetical protein